VWVLKGNASDELGDIGIFFTNNEKTQNDPKKFHGKNDACWQSTPLP